MRGDREKFDRIYIEITNICNLQCDFCPPVQRDSAEMDSEFFESVISQVAPLTHEVALHLMGEPLRHSGFPDFLKRCEKHNLPVNLTTNGSLLNLERANLILSSPIIRQVNFSVHSFEANFGSQDVEAYLKRIFAFTRDAFKRRPELFINYRIWDLQDSKSLSEKNLKIKAAIEKEFGFDFSKLKINLKRQKGYKIQDRLYLNFDSRFVWPTLDQPVRSTSGFCHGLSSHFGIHSDGTVVPCCLDKEAVINLGNLKKNSIQEILLSSRAQKLKQGFQKNQCVEDLCQRCDYIKRFD